ncbi:hypothetical protein Poli38472_005935 [Pythium oligandrum]|uniref:TATA box binding protein associated factor (TAF) histone-like fold domain-containing protein n=1 Tax=Pythium oligandrum TaxID=41045 RepID=A0A8K1CRG9_PYTOL|nr:hypothetical protein Poli38472_005935 [Pythium oligandrum]|eukprot:TMW68467.1 hypothetical protein Poli38472_005935 [Pythium oligandrum]
MSLLRSETLKVAAQSVGIEDLSDACVRELLPEVELRVREIIQDALKFRSHSKRPQLTTEHVNQALQARNVEGLYGFGAPGAAKFRQCEDQKTLFFADDDEVDLNEVLNAPLPHVPMQPALSVHWLAVEGVQPLIPENDAVEDDSTRRTAIKDEAFVGQVDRKPLVKHVLTEEMQLYYTKVTDAIRGDDFELQRAAFASLAKDPGIHQLLPYFSRFVYEEVKHSNNDLARLSSLMRVCRCLLVNQHLRIELYLHQLLPSILTCVLGQQLCENPADDHWALRKYAAQLVAQICQRYGETYEKIQARVAKTYHQAITDPECPFITQYGALHGMMYLGPLVLENLLFPNLEQYLKRLQPALSSSNANVVERLEAQNCLGILVHASGMYFSMAEGMDRDTSSVSIRDIMGLLDDAFGERLVPYTNASSTLTLCI